MSKENYETCLHVKSIGQMAVYVTPDCPQATMIKGRLERWARFLEDLLYTGGEQKQVGEDWKQKTMEKFGRVE